MLLVVGARVLLGIFQHSLKRQFVVDTTKAFNKGISNDDLGVATSLRAPVAVAAACIGHVALARVDIE